MHRCCSVCLEWRVCTYASSGVYRHTWESNLQQHTRASYTQGDPAFKQKMEKRLDTQLTEPRPHSPGSDYFEAGLQGRRLVHLLLQLGVVCDDGVKRLQTLSKVIHLHGVHVRVVVQVGLLERRRLSVRSMRGWAELSEETLQCMVV